MIERGQYFKPSSSEIARVSCGELQYVGCGGGHSIKQKFYHVEIYKMVLSKVLLIEKNYLTVVCCLNFFFTWRLSGSILPVC